MTVRADDLSRDPTVSTELHRVDDRFVPLRVRDLVEALATDTVRFGADAVRLREFAAALSDVIEQEAVELERDLVDRYAAFNPDRDTLVVDSNRDERSRAHRRDLLTRFDYLMDKANFERMSDVQIDQAVRTANSYGLRIRLNPDRIDELRIWVRGRGRIQRCKKTWRHPVKGVTRDVEVFRRMVVLARLRDDPHLNIKIFKDIPAEDVEALLPHAEVTMTWLDRLMMIGGSAGAAGSTGMKLFGMLAKVAALGQLLWVVLIGAGTVAVRAFLGYRRARTTRDSQRTRHLYFQNLSNNEAAIHRLIAMIAGEEIKEALLAYAFCRNTLEPVGSELELRTRVESYLRTRFAVKVDFDVSDAVETLTRLRLWSDPQAMTVVNIDAALGQLRSHWRQRRSGGYHAERIQA
ncbi:MAG: DUF3754 domain-containing protein, partial [Planctomycetota bacterium]